MHFLTIQKGRILIRHQPGHEYTKGNVKFCLAVSQSEPIKKLEAFAEQNQQTQGKFTIGDEKVFLELNYILCSSG